MKIFFNFIIACLFIWSCNKEENSFPNKTENHKKTSELKSQSNLKFSDSFPKNQKRFKFYQDFNEDRFSTKWRKETTKNNKYKIDINSRKGRFLDGFLITEMNTTGENGVTKRSEYGINLYDSISEKKFLSFSFQIPKSFIFDKTNFGREVMICQWNSKPAPEKDWSHYREFNEFNRPSVAVYISTNDNKNYFIILRYGNNGKKQFKHKGNIWSTIAVKKINTGEWYDMTFEIKWSINNDGYIAAWINNEPFTQFNGLHNQVYGANMHNASPNYFKFGQYRYFDDSHKHQIFFDELRIADNFKEVTLYKNLPQMFEIANQFKFIKNHK